MKLHLLLFGILEMLAEMGAAYADMCHVGLMV